MGLLYHVLPGSDVFGESGRAWHCACPQHFLRLLGYVVVGEINTLQPTASFSKGRLS